MFQKKNEISALIRGSFGVNSCFDLQAGYAFPGHVAFMTNMMTGGIDRSGESYNDFMKVNYFEGVLGYYSQFKTLGVFEIYGGYGGGSQKHSFAYLQWDNWVRTYIPDGNADISFSKLFIQPNIGIRDRNFEAAFSCCVSKLNFNEITFNSQYHLDELNLIKQYSAPWFLEPAFTFKGGTEIVKFGFQLGFAVNLTNPDMMYEKFRFNMGVYFNIGPKQVAK